MRITSSALAAVSALAALPMAVSAAPGVPPVTDGVYPAVVIDKATLAYGVDGFGAIARCRAIASSGSERRDTNACDALRNRGVPYGVEPARPIGGWPAILPDDYPELSVRRKESGIVGAIVEVDEAGKVAGCWIWHSSGSPRLDQRTCSLLLQRARFSPAKMNGRPIRAVALHDMAWPEFDRR